jgi:putative ABC transport system permease protein
MLGNPDLRVIIPLKTFESIFGKSHWATGMVLVDSPEHMQQALDHITGTLRRIRHTPPGEEDDFAINQADSMLELYQKLTGALFGVVIAVGLITLLVGGIGIMNIMLVSVRERTREIGLRRALGARRRTIITQFLLEASTVSAVGGGLGALVGLGIAQVVAFVGPIDAHLPAPYIVGGILFAGMMGLIFGIWPAARAANLDPVEALRYE